MASVDDGVIRLLKVKVGPRFHEVAPKMMLAIENGVLALEDWEEVESSVLEWMEWDEPFLSGERAGPFTLHLKWKHLVRNLDWIRDEKGLMHWTLRNMFVMICCVVTAFAFCVVHDMFFTLHLAWIWGWMIFINSHATPAANDTEKNAVVGVYLCTFLTGFASLTSLTIHVCVLIMSISPIGFFNLSFTWFPHTWDMLGWLIWDFVSDGQWQWLVLRWTSNMTSSRLPAGKKPRRPRMEKQKQSWPGKTKMVITNNELPHQRPWLSGRKLTWRIPSPSLRH